MKGNILLMGPSGAGKTTISKEIIRNTESHKLFTADTSRNIREGEQNGVDYNFISSYKIIKNSNLHQNYLTVNI